ncbi:glycosyltransferase [Luteitalea sp.]|uniref:glycosyltransferase family protein n=1 Tax=Luteitalea sp. TaxID=2004800 RepID=UPI0025C22BCF|nr:glycosyltransferase [Luteitalea sp.]
MSAETTSPSGAAPEGRVPAGATPTLRVLCLLLAPEPVPGPRYRVLQYLPVLESYGLACETMAVLSRATALRSVKTAARSPIRRMTHWVRVFVETQLGCLRLVWRLHRYDRVLLYRVAVPSWAVWLLWRRRRDLVYDFDDALDASEGGGWPSRLRRHVLARSLQRAVKVCAAVCTSNARNAEVVTALGGHPVVVPTSVDMARFPERPSPGGHVVLGWIGTPSTAQYLPAIEGALATVLAARPEVSVRLVGSGGNPFASLPAEIVEWTDAAEVEELVRFDIGLMPMPDTAWTRGKAALKALQYGAARTPTVASWTRTNEEILGAAGGVILCRTPDEWRDALLALVDDPSRRADMGERARAHVARLYSVQANGARLAAVLRHPAGVHA